VTSSETEIKEAEVLAAKNFYHSCKTLANVNMLENTGIHEAKLLRPTTV